MAQTVPPREPASVVAGDTVAWNKTIAAYPASEGWVLKYRLINAAGKIDITAGASGDDHAVLVAAADTDGWVAGTYAWQSRVEKAAERYTIETGSLVVKPDIAAAPAGYDTRTDAAKALAAVNSWLTSRDLAVSEYEIAGRRMKYIPMGELLKLRDKLKAEVAGEAAVERIAAGLGSKSKVLVRF